MTTYNQGLFANAPDPITPFSSDSELQSIENKVSSNIVIGRVTDIILNKDYPNINDYGGENAIGSVFFQELFNPTPTPIIALPFSLHSVIYPLVNELVIVFSLPNSNFTTDDLEANYYYMNISSYPISLHHSERDDAV